MYYDYLLDELESGNATNVLNEIRKIENNGSDDIDDVIDFITKVAKKAKLLQDNERKEIMHACVRFALDHENLNQTIDIINTCVPYLQVNYLLEVLEAFEKQGEYNGGIVSKVADMYENKKEKEIYELFEGIHRRKLGNIYTGLLDELNKRKYKLSTVYIASHLIKSTRLKKWYNEFKKGR